MSGRITGQRTCLVIFSGGQDSTTCLAWAKQNFEVVHALTFNYGQRHVIEIESAKKIAELLGVASHEILDLGPILKGTSPLVDPTQEVGRYTSVKDLPGGVEPTFIPARNALFLVIAANRAYVHGAHAMVTGVCQADYGGYPDCRQEFINLMAKALGEGVYGEKHAIPIHTPLMDLTKADSVRLASTLPGAMEALAYSHTDYSGFYPPDPFNHASIIRARGFDEAGMSDPLILRAIQEGKLPADYPNTGLVEGTKYNDPTTNPATAPSASKAASASSSPALKQEVVPATGVTPSSPVAGDAAGD